MKRGFTMLELVFVIVVLGILASIAVPRLFATRDDAVVARARADIASIRSGIINKHNTDMLSGKFAYDSLEKSGATNIFANVLQGGIKEKGASDPSGWTKGNTTGSKTVYTFVLNKSQSVNFTYDTADGSFSCPSDDKLCKQLTE